MSTSSNPQCLRRLVCRDASCRGATAGGSRKHAHTLTKHPWRGPKCVALMVPSLTWKLPTPPPPPFFSTSRTPPTAEPTAAGSSTDGRTVWRGVAGEKEKFFAHCQWRTEKRLSAAIDNAIQ